MNTPESNHPDGEAPLVEPDQSGQPSDPLSVDADRIARFTDSLSIAPDGDTANADGDGVDPSTGPLDSSVPESGDEAVEAAATTGGWNVLAVLSLVLAVVASPLAALFGYLAVGQVRRANQRGETIAWVAIGLGWLWLVAWAVLGISVATIWLEL